MWLIVVPITLYWVFRPLVPWISLKIFSNRKICFKKSFEGRVRPPRERAVIHGESLCSKSVLSLVLVPKCGYFILNLWERNPATYLRPSLEQSKLWEKSKFSVSAEETSSCVMTELLTTSSEKFGSSYEPASKIGWITWKISRLPKIWG